MTDAPLSLLVAQINPVVGDLEGNLQLALDALAEGEAQGADVVVLPELALCGYPPEDLILKPSFIETCDLAVRRLADATRTTRAAVVVGAPHGLAGGVTNSAFFLAEGRIVARYDKRELPNYGVFDEKRLFTPGREEPKPVDWRGYRIGLSVCEDIWFPRVPEAVAKAGADLMLVPNASPWRRTVQGERDEAFGRWAHLGLPFVFANTVGGQDELVFDGASYCVDAKGTKTQLLPDFETGARLVRFTKRGGFALDGAPAKVTTGLEADYRAAMTGLGDYVRKNRFSGVLIGLSGGIDSALTAAIAVDALGADKVWCVMMPSRYTSGGSVTDAEACAQALGVRYATIPIAPGVAAFDTMLAEAFAGTVPDIAEENIQSRLRGVILMALSNKFGPMVVTTGNKSEMAVGYATLYGDMSGGYNPLKDLYKMEVFALSEWRSANVPKGGLGPSGEVIPRAIIDKPPSAELREDQKDEDSLPPYPVLDAILRALIDEDADVCDLVEQGFEEAVVRRIEHLVYIAEYKRRQAPPGVKIGKRNFGRDRRYPITNRWRDD